MQSRSPSCCWPARPSRPNSAPPALLKAQPTSSPRRAYPANSRAWVSEVCRLCAGAYGPGGTGAGAGENASFTSLSTFSRLPSATGCRPPRSSRTSSTRPCSPHRLEAEVREEVPREDRPVHEEALVRRLSLRIPIGEGLERPRPFVASIADRRQEQRLHDPRARAFDEVRTSDEHGVLGRRARRQLPGAREELRRAVLHRPDHAAVVVAVDARPRRPTRPRSSRSNGACRRRARPSTATRRSRDRRTAPVGASPRSSRRPACSLRGF